MSVADQGSPAPILRRLPFTIRLSPQLVNQLLSQRNRPAAPGEISGLLFGLAEEGLVIAQAYRKFDDGSGAGGLSDRASQDKFFEQQLLASQKQLETAPLNLIGWYAIRETSGLSGSDLSYHDWYFPRPHDLAVILKREGPSNVSIEVYCRTVTGLMTEEGHRIGLVRLSTAPLESPLEIVPRPKIQDDFFMRAYEMGDAEEEKASGWKGTLASYRKVFSFLRPAAAPEPDKPEPVQQDRRPEPESPKAPLPLPVVPPRLIEPTPPQPSVALQAPSPTAPAPALPPVASAVPFPTNPAALPAPPPLVRPGKPWLPVLTVFVLTSILTFAVIYYLRTSDNLPGFLQAFVPQTGLGLRVEAQGDRLLLSWNRQNPLVRHAKDGSLVIEDGSQKRQVTLDASHVANGSILYHPTSDDVMFRLEVHGIDGHQIVETMRVLEAAKPVALDLSPPGPPVSSSQQGSKLVDTLKPSLPPKPPAANSERIARPIPDSATSPADLQASAAAKKNSNEEDVQATPEESPVKPLTAPDPGVVSPLKLANPPPAEQSKSESPLLNVPESLMTYQPPKPVRQVLPNVSLLPSAIIANTGHVEVLVKVDDAGRVTEAHAVSDSRKVNAVLMGASLAAARQWQFEPALLRGKPVPSQHSIVFQFSSPR